MRQVEEKKMKLISDFFTFALCGIVIAVLLACFSSGYEHSPIPIWVWVVTTIIAFLAWRNSDNSKAKELAKCAIMCPVAASVGTSGLVALSAEPLQYLKEMIPTLNLLLFVLMVGTMFASYRCLAVRRQHSHTD